MKSNPIISIIVPVYKAESYIERCVRSIITQTYKDFELILINDGSPDDSGIICDNIAKEDSRIRVIHKSNSGVSATRNLGIKIARGKYITFIDSDDWIEQNYLQSFFKYNFDDRTLIIQGISFFIPRRNTLIPMFQYEENISDKEHICETIVNYSLLNNGCPVAKLFVRDIIVKNNLSFDEDLTINEDHLFVLKYYQFIDNIILSENNGYRYFSDYQVPSLTKIPHSSEEYFTIAYRMLFTLDSFIGMYNKPTKYWSSIFDALGVGQIFLSLEAAAAMFPTLRHYKKCCILWNEYSKFTSIYETKSHKKKLLSLLLKYNKPFILMMLSFLFYVNFECIRRIKYIVKKTINY